MKLGVLTLWTNGSHDVAYGASAGMTDVLSADARPLFKVGEFTPELGIAVDDFAYVVPAPAKRKTASRAATTTPKRKTKASASTGAKSRSRAPRSRSSSRGASARA